MEEMILKKQSSLNQILDIFTKHESEIQEDEKTKKEIAEYKIRLIRINNLIIICSLPIKGITQQKNDARADATASAYPLIVALVRYANDQKDQDLLVKIRRNKWQLNRLKDLEMADFLQNLQKEANSHAADLDAFGCSGEMISKANESTTNFLNLIAERENLMKQKREARAQLQVELKNMEQFMKDLLDWTMDGFSEIHPELSKEYFWARQIQQPSRRHNHLLGYVTNKETGEPVGFGTATLVELNQAVNVSPGGRFVFKSLPEGRFTLRIANIKFHTVEIPIVRYAQERQRILVQMEPQPEPQQGQ